MSLYYKYAVYKSFFVYKNFLLCLREYQSWKCIRIKWTHSWQSGRFTPSCGFCEKFTCVGKINSTSWHVNDLMPMVCLHAVGQSVFNTVWEISSLGVLQKFCHYIVNDWHTKEHVFFFHIPGPTSSDDKNELQPKSSKNLVCHVIIKTEKNFIKVRNALINTVLTIITLHQREWGMCVLLVTEFCCQ